MQTCSLSKGFALTAVNVGACGQKKQSLPPEGAGGIFVIETSRTFQKRVSWGLLARQMIYAVLRSITAAAGKPSWFDELLTVAVSSL